MAHDIKHADLQPKLPQTSSSPTTHFQWLISELAGYASAASGPVQLRNLC
ncbi:MAG: hypothetical protein R3C45_09470 [Phycisphaerales bacterium]